MERDFPFSLHLFGNHWIAHFEPRKCVHPSTPHSTFDVITQQNSDTVSKCPKSLILLLLLLCCQHVCNVEHSQEVEGRENLFVVEIGSMRKLEMYLLNRRLSRCSLYPPPIHTTTKTNKFCLDTRVSFGGHQCYTTCHCTLKIRKRNYNCIESSLIYCFSYYFILLKQLLFVSNQVTFVFVRSFLRIASR